MHVRACALALVCLCQGMRMHVRTGARSEEYQVCSVHPCGVLDLPVHLELRFASDHIESVPDPPEPIKAARKRKERENGQSE